MSKRNSGQVYVTLEWWNRVHGDGLVMFVAPNAGGWTTTISNGKIVRG